MPPGRLVLMGHKKAFFPRFPGSFRSALPAGAWGGGRQSYCLTREAGPPPGITATRVPSGAGLALVAAKLARAGENQRADSPVAGAPSRPRGAPTALADPYAGAAAHLRGCGRATL